jgi:hypothetical protein
MALMPKFAPIVALLFLGTVLAVMLTAAVFAYGLARRQRRVMLGAGAAALLIPALYASLLLAASLKSEDLVLRPGGKKYFCEIDCHLAYSVERVTKTKSLGQARAEGTFYVITLKTWFDENTISNQRPREAPLYPNPRQVYIQESSGRRTEVSRAGMRALEGMGVESTPLSRPLIPGQSYVTQLVFDLPGDARFLRLYVGDADPMSKILVGHEESPLHRKIWFQI